MLALMELLKLFFSLSWDWWLLLPQVEIRLLQYLYLTFFIIKSWECTKKHFQNIAKIKCGIFRSVAIFVNLLQNLILWFLLWSRISLTYLLWKLIICDTSHDLVPLLQKKKREKLPWRSFTQLYFTTLLHGCFSRFLICANSNKSRKASLIEI